MLNEWRSIVPGDDCADISALRSSNLPPNMRFPILEKVARMHRDELLSRVPVEGQPEKPDNHIN